ncbi:MAG: carboxysome shell carbonic anhydrase, partial [bacterium]
MNTRNAYNLRAQRSAERRSHQSQARGGFVAPASLANPMFVPRKSETTAEQQYKSCQGLPARSISHPLSDGYMNARLAHCEDSVKGRFDAIVPTLKRIASLSYGDDFVEQASKIAGQYLDFDIPKSLLHNS